MPGEDDIRLRPLLGAGVNSGLRGTVTGNSDSDEHQIIHPTNLERAASVDDSAWMAEIAILAREGQR